MDLDVQRLQPVLSWNATLGRSVSGDERLDAESCLGQLPLVAMFTREEGYTDVRRGVSSEHEARHEGAHERKHEKSLDCIRSISVAVSLLRRGISIHPSHPSIISPNLNPVPPTRQVLNPIITRMIQPESIRRLIRAVM